MFGIESDFIAVGGNRHPSAADWSTSGGNLAFGTDRNVAIWNPLSEKRHGVRILLRGHKETVNAVKFFAYSSARNELLLTGSSDGIICLWTQDDDESDSWSLSQTVQAHDNSVNAIAVLNDCNIFVSASAKSEVKVWQCSVEEGIIDLKLVDTCIIKPSFFPLAISLTLLKSSNSIVIAIGGTKATIQILVSRRDIVSFKSQATLTGHEGWIRSLSFTQESKSPTSDILLASASQDKYIRLWRLQELQNSQRDVRKNNDPLKEDVEVSLSNKAHRFNSRGINYAITFEALLVGHEDWIYTARWSRNEESLRLLSASADNSLAIWELDSISGVWLCTVRLGEISAQKGATTATGSTGGFWVSLWSPNGTDIVSLGRTGSWRLWRQGSDKFDWTQDIAITGHTKEVRAIAWSRNGSYLLSTSADQTTRMFAPWKHDNQITWHEASRPQIHGYDLNCIDTLGDSHFITGADEKLLRVFEEPKKVALALSALSDISSGSAQSLPDTASIPVLGLSNKEIRREHDESNELESGPQKQSDDLNVGGEKYTASKPPFEDQLSRHLLWPESEKLYGHGYEICAVACSHDGTLVASACRATALDHAVIRIYETKKWHEIKPPLTAHTLTVTAIKFSADDQYLLGVGRDRQCSVFARSQQNLSEYNLIAKEPKAHTRMILDASWVPNNSLPKCFATASRDKTVAFWELDNQQTLSRASSAVFDHAVTAIAFANRSYIEKYTIACGLENGSIMIGLLSTTEPSKLDASVYLENSLSPSRSISDLIWRPLPLDQMANKGAGSQQREQLAIASDDASLQILTIDLDTIFTP